MVTPQELKMVCEESNEINGEKLFCVQPLRKKFAFDKALKNIFYYKENHSPHVSYSTMDLLTRPFCLHYPVMGLIIPSWAALCK